MLNAFVHTHTYTHTLNVYRVHVQCCCCCLLYTRVQSICGAGANKPWPRQRITKRLGGRHWAASSNRFYWIFFFLFLFFKDGHDGRHIGLGGEQKYRNSSLYVGYSQSSESSVHVYRSHLIQLFDVVRVVWFLNLADDYRLRWPFQLEYAMRFARPTTASSTRSRRDDSLKIRVYSVSAVIACLCIVYWPVWGAIYARNCLYRIVWVYPTWCPIAWRLLRAPLAAALHAYVRRLLHKYIHVPGNKKKEKWV